MARSFRFVVCDVLRMSRWPATSSPSSPTHGTFPRRHCSRSPRRSASRRRCSSTRPARAGMSGSGSSRRRASFRSRAIRCSAQRSCWPGRCSLSRSVSRPDAGSFPCRSSARGPASSSDGCRSRFRRCGVRRGRLAARGAPRRGLGAARRGVRQRVQHVYVTLGREQEVAALSPDLPKLERLARAHDPDRRLQLLRGLRRAVEDADVRAGRRGARGSGDGLRCGAARLHLARHGAIAFGDEIEISQGAELGRPSTLYARVDGRPSASRRSRWGAAPSSSPAASSGSDANCYGATLASTRFRA